MMGNLASMRDYVPAPNAWRDLEREAIAEQYGGANLHGMALPPPGRGEPRAWVEAVVPQEPWEWGLAAAGPVGRLAGKIAKLATAAGGMMGSLVDPAEASLLTKARTLLRGKPGGPHEGGIAAYHSSPHDFDKFDWSKLRTGEGANVYGAGFYAAENPAVSGQGGQYWQQFAGRFGSAESKAASLLSQANFDRERALRFARREAELAKEEPLTKMFGQEAKRSYIEQAEKTARLLEGNAPVGPRTYEVNIKARPEELLDWDKPLRDQPVIENIYRAQKRMPMGEDVSFKQWAREAGGMLDQPGQFWTPMTPAGAKTYADAGIPGIRYLDQGSRNAVPVLKTTPSGEVISTHYPPPSYNYVVTDPSKLEIMAKYGLVAGAPIGMGGLAAQDQYR